MNLLLDTHALLWWLADDRRLGPAVRETIGDPATVVLVSVVSLWEIVIKVRVGKLGADVADIERSIVEGGLTRLAISRNHLAVLATLPPHHRDPFDHLLIAQAIGESAVLVSNDATLAAYPIAVERCDR